MDCKEGDGQREGQAMGSSSPRSCGVTTDVDGMPATVNILKPQIDLIFSEVQKNLPTIDFDSSDISSDNDEPIFFHQQLKMGELSGAFDDDKDLDTSLSGGDSPLVGRTVEGTVSSSRVNGIKNNSEDENELKADDEGDDMYDNDLAAFLEKSSFPSDDEIVEWRRMSDKMEEYQRAEERHELDDLRRSQLLGHLTNIRQSLTASSTGTSTSTDGHFGQQNRSTVSTSTQACEGPVDPTQVTIETDEQEVGQQDDAPPTVKLFNQRLQDDMANVDPKERRRLLAQQNRSKDSEIASKFAPREPTMLSLRFFEEVDLDSVLHAASEENIPISSLRLVGRPTANQIPQSHSGGGDTNGKDAAEELTLIQKLAHLSMTHSGTDLNKVKAVDPRTGAVIEQTDPRLISNQSQDDAAPRQPQNTEGPEPGDFSTQTPGTSISSAGTNTATAGGPSKILFGRLKHEKRDKEPPTVFIDLRGFEKQKQEEHQGLESVQRVLGIQPGQQGEEESSSDEEEEMVERCDWRLTRQKIKQDLTTQGAAATLRPSSRTVGGGDGRQEYKKPPRVINLQEHSVSKKWARRPESSSADPGEEGEESEERRMREEEDNKARMEKLEAEREKERQREEAR
ncbi:uncharacterized protein LOC101857516 [Aplysia californica]|uniref:Uncharacterized protein LOC101857516 n=1 Tax=Aplysia californica TaxID=6500 RepID=A0ABM1W0H3_APLCA|nr:uncharacterized protein LOC101857516 [Aplysia californica]